MSFLSFFDNLALNSSFETCSNLFFFFFLKLHFSLPSFNPPYFTAVNTFWVTWFGHSSQILH